MGLQVSVWTFPSCLLSFDGVDEKFNFACWLLVFKAVTHGNDLPAAGRLAQPSPLKHQGHLKAAPEMLFSVLSSFFFQVFPRFLL